jgi:hypothetical protein
MTTAAINVDSLAAAIQTAYAAGYRHFGFRTEMAARPVRIIGKYCALSCDWDFARDMPSGKLDGTSATEITALWPESIEDIIESVNTAWATHRKIGYVGHRCYVIAGTAASYGDDPAEVVINNDTVTRRIGGKVIAVVA